MPIVERVSRWSAWRTVLDELPTGALAQVADTALMVLSTRLEAAGKPPLYYRVNRILNELQPLDDELQEVLPSLEIPSHG